MKPSIPQTGSSLDGQLYDLASDPGEQKNLASAQPERARQMAERLNKIRAAGADAVPSAPRPP